MKKILSISSLFSIALAGLLSACSKKEDLLIKPVIATKPLLMQGYVVGDPLQQIWNGEKERELHGNVEPANYNARQIAFFEQNMTMELLTQKGQRVYTQSFNISEDTCKVPRFYFDGAMHKTYTHPEPKGSEYTANFYLDVPEDQPAADVYIAVTEFYFDWDLSEPTVPLDTTYILVASGIKPNTWSTYNTVNVVPDIPKHHPESEFWPFVCLRKAVSNEFYFENDALKSTINLQLPNKWTTEGKVQSIHMYRNIQTALISNDLVQLFTN